MTFYMSNFIHSQEFIPTNNKIFYDYYYSMALRDKYIYLLPMQYYNIE